jgi:hypothetical protein
LTRHPGLRAGILGAAASIILSLLALIPFFGCLIMPISLLLYVGIGMLAAYLQLRRRPQTSKQRIAQLGFLAGLVTGLADGVVGLATVPLALPMTGGSEAILAQLPPWVADLLSGLGLAPADVFSTGGLFVLAALIAILTVVLATLLGTVGSLIYAATPKRR